ncbi:hypothetical protein K474DRAFT_1671116 [Panus rudis PR-1116 ss-1]|nr:hypothetical protein K474DRAFT_1671116 [Panus rudis PR-1116 ss-1]
MLWRYAKPSQRRKEFRVKVEETEKRILGDKVAQMFHLELACTAPDSRGHGYGTILIHKVTAKADARSLETYLWSSNSANTSFYNSVGFWTVAEVAMGKDNPTWDKEPVMVALVSGTLPPHIR